MQFEVFGVPANTLLIWIVTLVLLLAIGWMTKSSLDRSRRAEAHKKQPEATDPGTNISE